MFLLLSQILLWLVITVILYQLLLKVIPRAYLTLLGGFILFAIIVLAFFFPNERLVSAAWSVLSFPLKPLGATILLLAVYLNQGRKNKNLIVAALMIVLISSTPFLSNLLARSLELGEINRARTGAVTAPATQPVGAIILLGRGTTKANLPYRTQIQLTDTGDRILYTAQLYRQQVNQGSSPIVVVSAGPRDELEGNRDQTVEANDIATLLTQLGVPRDRIVLETRSQDLHTSAVEVANTLRTRGLQRNTPVILVTSGINSRRARLTFSDVGLTVIPRPTNFVAFQSGALPRLRLRVESFLPSVESLTVTTRIVEEFFTTIYYSLRGWLAPIST